MTTKEISSGIIKDKEQDFTFSCAGIHFLSKWTLSRLKRLYRKINHDESSLENNTKLLNQLRFLIQKKEQEKEAALNRPIQENNND